MGRPRGGPSNLSTRMHIDAVSREIVDAAMKVHSRLGPGLLESAYEACLAYELRSRGVAVAVQVPLPIVYDDVRLDVGYRLDMLVDGQLVVENKAVSAITPLFEAQLLSYLRLGGFRVGLLVNYHVPHLKDGIRRMVNGL